MSGNLSLKEILDNYWVLAESILGFNEDIDSYKLLSNEQNQEIMCSDFSLKTENKALNLQIMDLQRNRSEDGLSNLPDELMIEVNKRILTEDFEEAVLLTNKALIKYGSSRELIDLKEILEKKDLVKKSEVAAKRNSFPSKLQSHLVSVIHYDNSEDNIVSVSSSIGKSFNENNHDFLTQTESGSFCSEDISVSNTDDSLHSLSFRSESLTEPRHKSSELSLKLPSENKFQISMTSTERSSTTSTNINYNQFNFSKSHRISEFSNSDFKNTDITKLRIREITHKIDEKKSTKIVKYNQYKFNKSKMSMDYNEIKFNNIITTNQSVNKDVFKHDENMRSEMKENEVDNEYDDRDPGDENENNDEVNSNEKEKEDESDNEKDDSDDDDEDDDGNYDKDEDEDDGEDEEDEDEDDENNEDDEEDDENGSNSECEIENDDNSSDDSDNEDDEEEEY